VGTVAERLYYDSAALEFEAVVTDIRLDSTDATGQLWQVALDRTAFYPTGGGQPFDTGVLVATAKSGATLEVAVERVEEDANGEVWHYVRKPLVAGTEVTGRVEWARRIDHEQQHSGQHLISAMFLRELGLRTVSFHLGAEASTIDLDMKERPSDADVQRVEEAANRVVYEQRPMLPHWVEREFAEEMLRRGDLRKLPERPGRMRIVQMQGIEFNACGGTHVRNTGEIGAVLLRRLEKVKQGWRVEFVCGRRAVQAARLEYELLSSVARVLSVGAADVPARVEKLLEEKKAQAKELKRFERIVRDSPRED
jgi:alanyl-tRNA synthetase